ncbi:hypothetical protein DMN91_013060, partial [Ooceraea biroi]
AVADPVKDGSSSASSESPTEIKSLLASADRSQRKQVLLATALVTLSSPNGRTAVVRALLDQGSEVTLQPSSPRPVIMKNLTSYSPDHGATLNSLEYLSHVEWADPNPASSDPIDILIGADIYGDILREGLLRGFELRKWASNSASLLSDLDDADHGLACNKTLQSSERLNVLEIRWNPNIDVFEFQVSRSESLPNTKRAILSSIAKLYDPLGWVTPVVISAKIFMQRLWRHNLGWDETLPDALLHHWTTFYDRLDHLNLLPIPRWTRLEATTKKIELHGFSDASNAALAAVVYL